MSRDRSVGEATVCISIDDMKQQNYATVGPTWTQIVASGYLVCFGGHEGSLCKKRWWWSAIEKQVGYCLSGVQFHWDDFARKTSHFCPLSISVPNTVNREHHQKPAWWIGQPVDSVHWVGSYGFVHPSYLLVDTPVCDVTLGWVLITPTNHTWWTNRPY